MPKKLYKPKSNTMIKMRLQHTDFQEITPDELPKALQRWLALVIDAQLPFNSIKVYASCNSYSFWFRGETFGNLLETIRIFPGSYRLYGVDLGISGIHFQCDADRKKRRLPARPPVTSG